MSKQYRIFVQKSLKFFLVFFISSNTFSADEIKINNLLSNIEVASNPNDRRKGLMFRKSLPEDHGMFFVWEYRKRQCMWMRNTYIPLNVAYIDTKGKILEIYEMLPLSEDSICSKKRVKYALEVNLDWFKRNNLQVGDQIDITEILDNDY
tara:strand:+ start:254 stop:703 length:450 start_codon:yes stop_codon:yes gene_type:complete